MCFVLIEMEYGMTMSVSFAIYIKIYVQSTLYYNKNYYDYCYTIYDNTGENVFNYNYLITY